MAIDKEEAEKIMYAKHDEKRDIRVPKISRRPFARLRSRRRLMTAGYKLGMK